MFKIPKQEYTAEFKELAVKRGHGGEGIAKVARELGLVEQTLRNWVKAAKTGKLNPPGTKAKPRMTADSVTDALTLAWFRRKPGPGLMHHSDRGTQ